MAVPFRQEAVFYFACSLLAEMPAYFCFRGDILQLNGSALKYRGLLRLEVAFTAKAVLKPWTESSRQDSSPLEDLLLKQSKAGD